jgi:hypothetical protein
MMRAILFAVSRLGLGEQAPISGERGGLGSLLEFEVLEPDVDGILEASIPHRWRDLLLGFDLADQPTHLPIGAPLVEEPVADPAAAFPPASLGIRFQPRSPEPALELLRRRVAPLRFVEGRALVGPHHSAPLPCSSISTAHLRCLDAFLWGYVQAAGLLHRSIGSWTHAGTNLGTSAAQTRLIETDVPLSG